MARLERAIVRARHGVVKRESDLFDDPAAATEAHQRALEGGARSGYVLAAEVPGIEGIAGEVRVRRHPYSMVRHVGVLSLGVHPAAQGQGLGRLLMDRLLTLIRDHRDDDGGRYRRVELCVRGDNPRAQSLYRSLGFVQEGVRKNYVLGDDGRFVDDLMMALMLDDL